MPISSTNIRQTVQRVKTELAAHLSKNKGVDLKSFEILNAIQRPFSIIVFFLIRTSTGNQQFVMKKVVHDPINMAITKRENQAVVEYEILRHLYPKFREVDGCAVPRPILVIPEIETFLMEFVEGRLLSDELRYARYWANKAKFGRLRRYYYLCGKWLRHFQEFTGSEKAGPEAFDSLVERCDLRLKLIEEVGNSRCPKDLRHWTMDLLCGQLSRLTDEKVMTAGRHGDFGHWNILVHDNGITVLDFLGYAKEPIPYDILKILISLDYWKNHPAFSSKRLGVMKRSFLEGFGELPAVPFALAAVCEIYHRVAVIYGCLSNPGTRFPERVMKHRALKESLRRLDLLFQGKVMWQAAFENVFP